MGTETAPTVTPKILQKEHDRNPARLQRQHARMKKTAAGSKKPTPMYESVLAGALPLRGCLLKKGQAWAGYSKQFILHLPSRPQFAVRRCLK